VSRTVEIEYRRKTRVGVEVEEVVWVLKTTEGDCVTVRRKRKKLEFNMKNFDYRQRKVLVFFGRHQVVHENQLQIFQHLKVSKLT
jgi:hypothetical protein